MTAYSRPRAASSSTTARRCHGRRASASRTSAVVQLALAGAGAGGVAAQPLDLGLQPGRRLPQLLELDLLVRRPLPGGRRVGGHQWVGTRAAVLRERRAQLVPGHVRFGVRVAHEAGLRGSHAPLLRLGGTVQHGSRLGRQAAHELAGGDGLGERMRLPRPQVEAVGIAALARRGADAGREVVHVRVGARRARVVLGHPAVGDAAREPPGERARELGRGLGLDRRAVGGRGGRLRAEHERGAELRRGGAEGEHGRDRAAGRDPAGGDERQVRGGGDELEQREQADLAGRAVVEAPAVAAGLDALDDERVGACLRGLGRLRGRRHRHPDG